MPKPRIQSRVDGHVKADVESYAEDRNMSEAEAVRKLVSSGLRAETAAQTDGGEVADRVDELRAQQERRDRRHDALLGVTLVVGVLVVSGTADGPLALLAGVAAGVALIISSLAGYVGGSDE